MSKQLNQQRFEKERLLVQNPFLQKIAVKPFTDSGYTVAEVSDFMEGCWTDYYHDPMRIIFSPDLLAYLGMGEKEGNNSLIAEYEGRLVGTILSFENIYIHGDQRFSVSITTGLTSDPSLRGKRMAQFLSYALHEAYIDNGYDFGICWLDNRVNGAGSSYQIYKKENSRVHALLEKRIWGKFLDYRRTVELRRPSFKQKMILKSDQILFPAGYKMTRGLDVVPFEPSMLQEVLLLLEKYQPENFILRYFSADELARRLGFSSKTCRNVAYVAQKNGRISGLIHGITNPILSTHTYIQLEGMLFHPGLSYKDRKAFVSAYEYAARHQYDCFAVIVPETVLNDRIAKFGYMPIATQALAALFYHDRLGYDETLLANLFAELK